MTRRPQAAEPDFAAFDRDVGLALSAAQDIVATDRRELRRQLSALSRTIGYAPNIDRLCDMAGASDERHGSTNNNVALLITALCYAIGRMHGLNYFQEPLALARLKQLAALENKRNALSSNESERIRSANEKLLEKFPIRAERYREVARKLKIKDGRVRYVVEGPRRQLQK